CHNLSTIRPMVGDCFRGRRCCRLARVVDHRVPSTKRQSGGQEGLTKHRQRIQRIILPEREDCRNILRKPPSRPKGPREVRTTYSDGKPLSDRMIFSCTVTRLCVVTLIGKLVSGG